MRLVVYYANTDSTEHSGPGNNYIKSPERLDNVFLRSHDDSATKLQHTAINKRNKRKKKLNEGKRMKTNGQWLQRNNAARRTRRAPAGDERPQMRSAAPPGGCDATLPSCKCAWRSPSDERCALNAPSGTVWAGRAFRPGIFPAICSQNNIG